ncbi:MAG: TonB-dependent receptor [Acidimicrobiia bacterium]|nr:TonB-dependent receptor [Acidimicrobiia bacterium]
MVEMNRIFAAVVSSFVVVALALGSPPSARGQALSGTIAGVARDATGAVLPGVTVEASSPALIERVRVAVTDTQGQYKIVDLRPGLYAVTFTLPGFSTYRREGIELTTGFTATVNGDLTVGSLEETVTVTGASPVVDVQNSRTQTVLTRQVLDTIPTNKSLAGYTALTLGATRGLTSQDVGGDKGESAGTFGLHGAAGSDTKVMIDGMYIDGFGAGNGGSIVWISQMAVQEVSLATRGISAEGESGGVQMNHVLKDGGNTLSFSFAANGANSSFQSKTLTDELRARGLTSAPTLKKVYDWGTGVGGPIKRDRIWFYGSFRLWGAQNFAPGNYYQKRDDPAARGGLIYVPDLDRPAFSWLPNEDYSGRVTWQVSAKQKVAGYVSYQRDCNCYLGVTFLRAPEASGHITYRPVVGHGTWNYPATNRLLFEAGVAGTYGHDFVPRHDGVTHADIPVTDLLTGRAYNSYGGSIGPDFLAYGTFYNHILNERVAVSYVTGTHAFKTGFHLVQGWQHYNYDISPIEYQFRGATPAAIRLWAMPQEYRSRLKANLGIYAQDQWTLDRLTLNLGVRLDFLNAGNPAFSIPAGPFVPERTFSEVTNVPNWKDLAPRVGAAYDVFGNGRTAFKASVGRYVRNTTFSIANENNLAYRITTNAFRSWNDANGNYVPECTLTNPLANGECGQLSNLNLGKTIPSTTYDDEFLQGWFARPYIWQTDATVQHELRPDLAVMAGYYRTWYGNFPITTNRAVTSADFDPFCITVPSDTRLPGGGGQQLCGLYNIKPQKFGQVDNLVTHANNFGDMTQVYNGFDVAMRARFGESGLVQGGVASGRTTYGNCLTGLGDTPMSPRPGVTNVISFVPAPVRFLPADLCKTTIPFASQTQYKASAVYPLPWYGIQLSGVFQNLAGPDIQATWNVPNAVVAPSLGRNLAGAVAVTTVDLLEPFTRREGRVTQFDLRVTKLFRFRRVRVRGDLDLYNLFNSRDILGVVSTYGPVWLRPTSVLGGRLIKVGGQLDF